MGLVLREFKPEDADTIVSWVSDENVFYLWSAGTLGEYPLTADRLIENYKNNPQIYHLVLEDDGQMIGQIIIRYPNADDLETVRLGYVIVDSSIRGKGYGNALIKEAISYAKDKLKAKKITIGVFEDNEPAKKCYFSNGFKLVEQEKPEIFELPGRQWVCLELEMNV